MMSQYKAWIVGINGFPEDLSTRSRQPTMKSKNISAAQESFRSKILLTPVAVKKSNAMPFELLESLLGVVHQEHLFGKQIEDHCKHSAIAVGTEL